MSAEEIPHVAVLLSTFNGEKYIDQLLDSVLSQEGVRVTLYIRDDGSTDGTTAILGKRASVDPRIKLAKGENLGVNGSFFSLLEQPMEADYFAFCDQDDVWLKRKLVAAVGQLREVDPTTPALYGCGMQLVDQDLKPLGSTSFPKIEPGIANALLESSIPGCTAVMNKSARTSLLGNLPSSVRYFDWWVYQVISSIGVVKIDDDSHILYRQHGTNVVGTLSGFNLWLRRLARFSGVNHDQFVHHQAAELLERYGDRMPEDSRSYVDQFVRARLGLVSRVRFAIQGHFSRRRRIDDLVYRVLYALDRL